MKDFNILYVDCEQDNLNYFESVFNNKYNIFSTKSGVEGLELINNQLIDLIITGMKINNISVQEFVKKLEEKRPYTKFISLNENHNYQLLKKSIDEIYDEIEIEKERIWINQNLHVLLNNSLDAIITIDNNHKIRMVNPALIKLFGYSEMELIGSHLNILIPNNVKNHDQLINKFGVSKKVSHVMGANKILFGQSKSGKIIPIETNLTKIEKKGKIFYNAIIRDVSEKIEFDKIIEENEKKFRGVFESMADVFIRRNLEGEIILASPSIFEVTGYMAEEIIHQNISNYFIDKDIPNKISQKLLNDGGVQSFELELIKKDGSVIVVSTNAKLFYDVTGNPIGVESVFRDITKAKKISEQLAESEQKFRSLVTNTEEIIYMIDKDGTFLLSEGKGLEKLGLKGGDVVGMSVFDLYKDYPDMLDDMKRAFNGETVISEIKIDNNYFKNWYTPHLNRNGITIGLLGMSINTNEQKQAELKILSYQDRLKELALEITLTEEKQRKQIAIDLHDDVGQSLASSRIELSSLYDKTDDPELSTKLKSVSQTLLRAIQATRNAIFNLSPPELNELGLYAAIHDWINREVDKKHDIVTKISSTEDKYPLKDSTRILVYRSIKELVMNTVKHAKANRLIVNLKADKGKLEIIIEDNGIGFEYNNEVTKFKRKGYGLFSVKERVSDMGGKMTIYTKPGEGTKIYISVPLKEKRK
jgi:PAS domain S-box-containing protein